MIKLTSIIQERFLREEEELSNEHYQLKRELEHFESDLIKEFPQLEDLSLYLSPSGAIYLASIKIKPEERGKGYGKKVLRKIFEFGDKHGKIITLHPQPSPRYKEKLDRFYKALGFVHNKGRNIMYQHTSPFAKTMYRKPNKINEQIIDIEEINKKYPIAGQIVNGLTVSKNIDNLNSIQSSFNKYKILNEVREIPMSDFHISGKGYSVSENNKIQKLMISIENSKSISPLIVAIDKEGPYVLEGVHRIDALKNLGIEYFPALVVIDLDE